MPEPIPGAAERVRSAAQRQISHPKSRHWLRRQTHDEIYAYAPDSLRVWLRHQAPPSKDMSALGEHYRGILRAFTPTVEREWIRNVVTAAKDHA